jgi:hypothetical protein
MFSKVLKATSAIFNIEGVGKIMETLIHFEIEFVLATMKELQLATRNVLPFVYTFVVLVSVHK